MTTRQSVWTLYLIRCNDNSLYAGITLDPQRRFAEHGAQGKKCAKYLRGKAPLTLVFTSPAGPDKSAASQLEYAVKRLPKAIKEQLITGEVTLSQLHLQLF